MGEGREKVGPRAEPWAGGKAVADPSTGEVDYQVDPLTGEIVSGGGNELEVPPPDAPEELTSVEGQPFDSPYEGVEPGFVAGESVYNDEQSTDRTHVWDNPDGSVTVHYGTRAYDVDETTGEPVVETPELETVPGGGFRATAGKDAERVVEVPARAPGRAAAADAAADGAGGGPPAGRPGPRMARALSWPR